MNQPNRFLRGLAVQGLIALFAALLVASCARPAVAAGDSRAALLHSTGVAFAEEHHAIGMGVAVIENARVVLDDAIGFADREAGRGAKTTTLYRLGSISKPVCAAIAMQLVEKGVLALDRGVGEYVPDLPEPIRPLTLAQLLSHTSGVRHYAEGREDNGTLHRSTREALELFIRDPLLFEPGAKYSYSTHAYTLVSAAIESVTKRDYVSVLRERLRVIAPTLDCEVLSDKKPERASLYDRLDSGEVVASSAREDNSWKYGGGGLESTALDLARFGVAMLDDKLVAPGTRASMWSPTRLKNGSTSPYGLGWRVSNDGSTVSHSGAQQGCSSMLLLVPGEGRVIAILTNTDGVEASKLADSLRKQLAGSAAAGEPATATK